MRGRGEEEGREGGMTKGKRGRVKQTRVDIISGLY